MQLPGTVVYNWSKEEFNFFNVFHINRRNNYNVCVEQNFFLNSQSKSERKKSKHHTYRFQTILQIHSKEENGTGAKLDILTNGTKYRAQD